MPDYRVYILDESGHVADRVDLKCPNDEAATERAQQLVNDQDIELWQLDRQVAIFKARER